MRKLDLRLVGARVLSPEGLEDRPVSLAEGVIVSGDQQREVNLDGFLVLPGIVDIHGDGFERHLAPRRGAIRSPAPAVTAARARRCASTVTAWAGSAAPSTRPAGPAASGPDRTSPAGCVMGVSKCGALYCCSNF